MTDDAATADRGGSPAASSPVPVPPLLRDLAGWTWRLLTLALAAYLFVRLLDILSFIVLPFFAALLATALAYPLVRLLRGIGLKRSVATWITVLLAAVLLGGVAIFVINRAVAEYPDLVKQTSQTVTSFRHFLTVDLHVKSSSTSSVEKTITDYLNAHSSAVASGTLSGIATVAEAIGAFVLWFFMTFFLLYDGENIWHWIVKLFPAGGRQRALGAGDHAWDRLAGFVRGTFIIAVIHAVVAAVTLSILGVPLVAPLTLLVFLGSFLPIVGSISVGVLSVAITLVTRGTLAGIILSAVLITDNQIEAHLLQPLLVGRYVRLHPLAVAISIAGGGVLAGIPGAILAVPIVAVVYAVVRYLATGERDVRPPGSRRGKRTPDEGGPDSDAGAGEGAVPGEDPDAPTAEAKLVPEAG
jgi:predicted PurR-regulated permease PerM